jgi:hypothetical protein
MLIVAGRAGRILVGNAVLLQRLDRLRPRLKATNCGFRTEAAVGASCSQLSSAAGSRAWRVFSC